MFGPLRSLRPRFVSRVRDPRVETIGATAAKRKGVIYRPLMKSIAKLHDCRVRALFKVADNPFQMGERPRVRTTEDYLEGRVKGEDDETVH